jgi:hypothetical protein
MIYEYEIPITYQYLWRLVSSLISRTRLSRGTFFRLDLQNHVYPAWDLPMTELLKSGMVEIDRPSCR